MDVDVKDEEEYRKDSSADFAAFRHLTKNRSEGERSEGSSAHSPHSTPRQESGGVPDDDIAVDDDERGVSPPPLSHPPLYNPLFANTAAIQLGLSGAQLGLSGATMPLGHHHLASRYNGDKVVDGAERMAPLVAATQKEISQQ